MSIEDIIEDIKVKRPNDAEFQMLYREWKLNITEGKDQGETLGKLIVYLQTKGFLNVWSEDFEDYNNPLNRRGRGKSPYLD
jgi:hypothetical protein